MEPNPRRNLLAMNPRAWLLATLLASPVWSQEPAAETPKPSGPSFDLRSDAIKKIVNETASTQFADVREAEKPSAKSENADFKYVPPEKPVAPPREPPRKLPTPPPREDGFLSQVVDILFDEMLGTDDVDEVTVSNLLLRCRVQKDLKTSPPGTDGCPSMD
jgi:hypothetical protein